MCAPRRHFGEPPAAISGAPGGLRGAPAAITGLQVAVGVRGGVGGVIGAQAAEKKKKSFNYLILLLKATLVSNNLVFSVCVFLFWLFFSCFYLVWLP